MLSIEEKALSLAYSHCELLKYNLNVTIHELKIKGKKAEPMVKKLTKLRTAAYEAFFEINELLKKHNQMDAIRADIEEVLNETWSGRE